MPAPFSTEFDRSFATLSNGNEPYGWQRELSNTADCGNRLIRIPTGFGKTLGVLAAWVWHRVQWHRDDWPRRLVWCLPMRVLVEQTKRDVCAALESLGLLWDEQGSHDGKVGVHLLMGGADAGQWYLYPENDAVLIGTQDMLLSRAMNRGYASPRARWPMEFGLLNQDALWVMDEVQLMDVSLATSVQLQAFRGQDHSANKMLRPCFTWWMSATLQQRWLEESPDTGQLAGDFDRNVHRIESNERVGHLWDDVTKHIEVEAFSNAKVLAGVVSSRHNGLGSGRAGPTLVVLNTVERAVEVWQTLRRDRGLKGTDVRLVHSRFRPYEREKWIDKFLTRSECMPGTDRIIVSTQVVEAGVDISASLLFTELAPWPSLVQRFGRCARWGGEGHIFVVDFQHDSDKKAAPYSKDELDIARRACDELPDAGPAALERFEEEHEVLLPRLFPYEPAHLLLRHELDELFDTSSDLSGGDIDISRFIRSGDERDVQIFWAEIGNDNPSIHLKPTRDELCRVPFLKVRDWLCRPKMEQLKPDVRAWVWSWLDRTWRRVTRSDIYPGRTVLVENSVGGYQVDSGWNPKSQAAVDTVLSDQKSECRFRPCWERSGDGWRNGKRRIRRVPAEEHADDAEDDESLSVTDGWQTIASHGLQVGDTVRHMATKVAPDRADLLHLAGRWHDLGKAHAAFQSSIKNDNRPKRKDIAKAPDIAWPCSVSDMYRIDAGDQRRGFRHELASTLRLFGVLEQHKPGHQALLGPWHGLLEAMEGKGFADLSSSTPRVMPTPIEQDVLDLSADDFDLLAYLVCAHHGKVRVAWHASPADQRAIGHRLRIRGVQEEDILPPILLAGADGEVHQLPAMELSLAPAEMGLSNRTGRSWSERVLNLVERHGPFTLAWFEALLRAADQRASKDPHVDGLLVEQDGEHGGRSPIGRDNAVADINRRSRNEDDAFE